MRTIFDFKKAGERLRKNWTKPYLLVGCPFRETARAILWACGVRSVGASDALSLLGIPVLGLLPVALLVLSGWWWWLLAYPLIVFLGYGPLDGFGERLHGDAFESGGDLYEAPLTDAEKAMLAAEKAAEKAAKEAKKAAEKKLKDEVKAARKGAKKAKER